MEDNSAGPAIEGDSGCVDLLGQFLRDGCSERADDSLFGVLRIEMQVVELVYLLVPLVPELLDPFLLAFLIRIAEGPLRKLLRCVTLSHAIN